MSESETRRRWEAVDRVFAAVIDVPESDQPPLLDRLCQGNAALRREVEALLDADRNAEDFLARTIDLENPQQPAPGSAPRLARIGAYRVLRLVSEGGMGAVYLGARADDLYQRHVAIKVIRETMDNEEIRNRFRTERQILARLEHPCIARLYDAGVSDEGVPFLVMEWVGGLPLDQYCDQSRLTVRQRLELFCKVCSAIEFAHHSLLVHRDIKPDNILVTEEGVPKLIDFGIAKPLAPEQFEHTVRQTATGMALMTPRYASPEQVLGEPVTIATDIYALGVVLHELLTGALPYRTTQRSAHELARQICNAAAMSPSQTMAYMTQGQVKSSATDTLSEVTRSRRASRNELRRRFKGDLDTIVLTALRKEPERRYASVQQFASDIGGYLSNQPISARPDTWNYRTGKLLRRHPLGFAASVLVLLATVTFGLVFLNQARQVAAEAEKSAQALSVLVDVFKASDGRAATGGEVSAREVLENAAARIGREQGDSPELQATLFGAIGQAFMNLGLLEEADELLARAVELRLLNPGPGQSELARARRHLGRLRLAQSDLVEAQSLAEQAVAGLRSADDPPELASALSLVAEIADRQDRLTLANDLLQEARELLQGVSGDHQLELAGLYNQMGSVARRESRYGIANSLHRQALEIFRGRLGEQHFEYARTLSLHADVLLAQGSAAEAEQILRRALAIQREALGPDHFEVFTTTLRLGRLLERTQQLALAESLYRNAVAEASRNANRPQELSASLRSLSRVLLASGKSREALRNAGAAVGVLDAAVGGVDWRLVEPLRELAEAQLTAGEIGAAEQSMRRVLSILNASPPESRINARLLKAHQFLGEVLTMQGRYIQAREQFAQAARLRPPDEEKR